MKPVFLSLCSVSLSLYQLIQLSTSSNGQEWDFQNYRFATTVILFVKKAQRSEVERCLVHLVHLVHLVQHLVQRWKGILCITLVSLHWLPRWQSVLLAARKWWNCDHQWYIPARGQHSLPTTLVLGIFTSSLLHSHRRKFFSFDILIGEALKKWYFWGIFPK